MRGVLLEIQSIITRFEFEEGRREEVGDTRDFQPQKTWWFSAPQCYLSSLPKPALNRHGHFQPRCSSDVTILVTGSAIYLRLHTDNAGLMVLGRSRRDI